ncbi:hypothetical protein EDL79_01960 [Ehrlichia ruminantium]|uniref:Uncharacterized protein n=1 Tax=Ehrlichia ruminantium TaxID=779 RepID=A0AAE6QB66_EHRRU|nr:hypothetical protein [Ehrlichia ruminantium]QGR02432.1 hypothetical protein EDL81_01965 [Ehrlichia ruminantium]QGR03351.1 hypothetical protein EDL80_01960 [Ehrlichia ruminantium]QGR04278.1 hypothetical protein EDL79_01960 [Ehrlichia ruminantium]
MNKLKSAMIFSIITALLIIDVMVSLACRSQNNTREFYIAASVVFGVILFAFIVSLINVCMHYDGISLRRMDKNRTFKLKYPNQEVVLFLQVPPEKMSGINTEANIINFSSVKTGHEDEDKYALEMTQRATMFSTTAPSIQLNGNEKAQLLMHDQIKVKNSGLYIVANCNKLVLSQNLKRRVDVQILHPIIDYGKLSLVYKHVEFYGSKQLYNKKDPYGPADFAQLLRFEVETNTEDEISMRYLYDIIAVEILSECPKIDEYGWWTRDVNGKIAASFFSMFNYRLILGEKRLSREDLIPKLELITEYVASSEFHRDKSYDPLIFDRIRDTYFSENHELYKYSFLCNNVYTSVKGERVSDLIRQNIEKDKCYYYIYSIASCDNEDVMSQKTNKFIRDILQSEKGKLEVICNIDSKKDIEKLLKFDPESKEVRSMLKRVLGPCIFVRSDVSTLIKCAQDFVMENCKERMQLLHCDRYSSIDVGYINDIIVCSTEQKSAGVASDLNIVDGTTNAVLSDECITSSV